MAASRMQLASSMGKSQRTKGHSFERNIAKELRKIYPEARRHLEYQDGEANGIDLQNTGRYKIQCKCLNKQPQIPAVMMEIKNVGDEDIPMVIWKQDGKGTYAAVRFEDMRILMSLLP